MSATSSPDDRAQRVLEQLPAAVPGTVVIGGWASWLRTHGARSHDVDLIVEWDQLQAISEHARVERSTARHAGATKWVGEWDGVHLDLYVPFQSRLGTKLELRVETLVQYTEQIDNHRVLSIPAQTAAKWAALVDRVGTTRGAKDREEVIELLANPEAQSTAKILHEASAKSAAAVNEAISEGFAYLQATAPRAQRRQLAQMQTAWLPSSPEQPTPPATQAGGLPKPGGATRRSTARSSTRERGRSAPASAGDPTPPPENPARGHGLGL